MKQNIINLSVSIKQALIDDILDRYLLIVSLCLFLIDFFIWRFFLSSDSLYIFLKINVYPVKYLAVVIMINTFLTISAHEREKEVGYLLLLGNIIVGLLIFILEAFYLIHLP